MLCLSLIPAKGPFYPFPLFSTTQPSYDMSDLTLLQLLATYNVKNSMSSCCHSNTNVCGLLEGKMLVKYSLDLECGSKNINAIQIHM